MAATMTSWLLLAERSLFRDMGSGFRDKRENMDGTDLLMWMLLVVGVFVVIGIIAHFVARRDKRELYNSPRALFRQLCKAHGLEHASRALLKRMARQQQLAQPARLFLEPERFGVENLSPELAAQQAAIAALKQRLFGLPAGQGA